MAGGQELHDPKKALSDLRDQLARDDKPIAFLLGAGTSCAVKVPAAGNPDELESLIPAIPGLTDLCKGAVEELGPRFSSAWQQIVGDCLADGQPTHIEGVLSRVRMMLAALGPSGMLAGLKREELAKLEETVRRTIACVVNPAKDRIPRDLPHRQLARWVARSGRTSPIEIFTLNYDVLLEYALEAERVPFFDGFVGSYQPFFFADSLQRSEFAPGETWTRLWKLHGSINWRRVEVDGHSRIVRGAPSDDGEMILPSFQKYDESRQQPYLAFIEKLRRFLDRPEALLVTLGFSFGDQHINNVILTSLENRPRTHVWSLQFVDQQDDTDLLRAATHRSNIIVLGPTLGIIGSRKAAWAIPEDVASLGGLLEVKETPPAMDPGSGAAVPTEKVPTLTVGDFASFCRLLESMARTN